MGGYMLQYSLGLVTNNKIVMAEGQWLPFRGHDAEIDSPHLPPTHFAQKVCKARFPQHTKNSHLRPNYLNLLPAFPLFQDLPSNLSEPF